MPGPAAAGTDPADAVSLVLGRHRARIGACDALRKAALDLRHQAFGSADRDAFDGPSLHGTVTDTVSGASCVAFRVRVFPTAEGVSGSYTAQHYDLRPLAAMDGPVLELGRFCQAPAGAHPAALLAAWGALTALADGQGVALLIGCSSFAGADPERHAAALATLRAWHLGPPTLRPGRRAPRAVDLPGPEVAPGALPPLLRSYLGMGGWVSDHAVRDPLLDTLHVFTGLRVADIPEPRKARLRSLAQSAGPPQPLDVAPAAP